MNDTTTETAITRAAAALRQSATGAIQREGRDRYALSTTRTTRTPVVVDHLDEPTTVIESFAARYEDVNRHLALIGSPVVGLRLADWLDAVATAHPPQWDSPECPSCDTGRCDHGDVLDCADCMEEYPCPAAKPALALALAILGEDKPAPLTDETPAAVAR